MPESEEPIVVSGACLFGAQRLLPLILAFNKETNGVKTGKDIEYIHRMRVASRRLRAALPLFASCFPEKKYRGWMREIRKITRALGEARDIDVQIAFLERYLKEHASPGEDDDRHAPAQELDPRGAIPTLLYRLKRRRVVLQKKVLSALGELEMSHTIDGMQASIREISPVSRPRGRQPAMYGIPPVAAGRIGKRLIDMFAYEQWIHNPDAVAEHHAMRIAAKKLRYTMEVYAPLYKWELRKPIARIKKIQTLLGDMHDCDVWIDHITLALVKERTRLHSVDAGRHSGAEAIIPLKQLLADRERKRAMLHRSFIRFWASLSRSQFWASLRSALLTDIKVKYSVRTIPTIIEEQEAVTRLAMAYQAGVGHARHVTLLALQLFDLLLPLHNLTGRDRILLGYAGQLHDIGWKYGERRHRVQSADMIFSDEPLPFDLQERGIIGIAARLHAGKTESGAGGYLPLLSHSDQHRVQALAALLRVADGLDYRHLGIVQSLHCTVGPDSVRCDVESTGDASLEKARAREKSDLFREVFDRPLEIP
jgi:CHAD domain-containing protein